MLPINDVLTLWSALAAAARAPGRLHVLRASKGIMDGHWLHPVPTVVVCLLGTVRIECRLGPAVDLNIGDAVVIAPGVAHRHVPLRRQAGSMELGFEYGWCDLEFHRAGVTLGASMTRQPAETLVQCLLAGESRALADLLLLVLERPLQDVRPFSVAALRMRDRIRSHGLTSVSAMDITRASRLRPSRAWQVFREHFGCTPHEALERRRCSVAAALLAQGMAVAEVALHCGYRDRGTFTRAFRRIYGRSPGRCRC
jgi:AraC-like DNA-binding protein